MRFGGKKNTPWSDHYTQQARKSGYPARSVFKLQEIQRKYRLIKKGNRVMDLGCAPGSWLLYAAELVGEKGIAVGIDLKPVTVPLPRQAAAFTADIFSTDFSFLEASLSGFNIILSDMAPDTTGNKDVDAAKSLELCRKALSIAHDRLEVGGHFVCKIFFGEDFNTFSDSVKTAFSLIKVFKPQSSRKASKEIYLIGMGKK
ncbi:MAG: RlmE family RNA methyltransferase [Thermodesulfobacteriota bacterium]